MSESLANWCRAALADDRTDADDRITLVDLLDQLGVMRPHVWDMLDLAPLANDMVGYAFLAATVRDIIRRNQYLAEALANWEFWHQHTFEDNLKWED